MRPSFSSVREQVLNLIESSDVPLSARNVHDALAEAANLATIYRALRYLEERLLVEAFTMPCSRDGTTRYYYRRTTPHVHYFHCNSCHTFVPLEACAAEELVPDLEKRHGCTVTGHVLYFTGYCSECAAVEAGADGGCA